MLGAFDEGPLSRVTRGHAVAELQLRVTHPLGDDGPPVAVAALRLTPQDPPKRRARPVRQALAPEDRPTFDALRTWRGAAASAAELAPYRVVTDRTLAAVVARRPSTLAQLAEVPGVGPKTVAVHGLALLEALGDALRAHHAPPGDQAVA